MGLDHFHISSYIRNMCKSLLKPDHQSKNNIYESVNTDTFEQKFSHLSKFKKSFKEITILNRFLFHNNFSFYDMFSYHFTPLELYSFQSSKQTNRNETNL